MNALKNIIFDLGGVLYNIDYNLTIQAFKKLGIENFDTLYSQAHQENVFDLYETGKINSHEFRMALIQKLSAPIDEATFDTAWNAMLIDFPKERIGFLERLKKRYRLFLLSNTNDIHFTAVTAYFKKNLGFTDLNHLFEKAYFSHHIGLRKPDVRSFAYVLENHGLQAGETLFIDDLPQNIAGASKLGIRTHFLDLKKGETVLDLEKIYF